MIYTGYDVIYIFQRTCMNISINLHGILAIFLVSRSLIHLAVVFGDGFLQGDPWSLQRCAEFRPASRSHRKNYLSQRLTIGRLLFSVVKSDSLPLGIWLSVLDDVVDHTCYFGFSWAWLLSICTWSWCAWLAFSSTSKVIWSRLNLIKQEWCFWEDSQAELRLTWLNHKNANYCTLSSESILLQEPLQHRQTPACRDLLLYKPQHMFLLYEDHQGPSMQPGSLDLFTGRNISTTGVALWRHGWVGNSLNTKTGRSGGQRSFLYQGIWRVRQSGESVWITEIGLELNRSNVLPSKQATYNLCVCPGSCSLQQRKSKEWLFMKSTTQLCIASQSQILRF